MTAKTQVICDRCGRDLSEEYAKADGDHVAIFVGSSASMAGSRDPLIRLDFCKNCWSFVKSNLVELISEAKP